MIPCCRASDLLSARFATLGRKNCSGDRAPPNNEAASRCVAPGLSFHCSKCRHSGLQLCRVAVRSANCSCPRLVAKTSAPQSPPSARQLATSRAPLLRMRFLWTGYLSARHDFWPRPLSVGTHPTVTHARRTLERRLGSSDSPNLATSAALVSWP